MGSRAGSAWLAQVVGELGLTGALWLCLAGLMRRRGRHDPGRVIGDLALVLAGGGECVPALGAVGDQQPRRARRRLTRPGSGSLTGSPPSGCSRRCGGARAGAEAVVGNAGGAGGVDDRQRRGVERHAG